MQVGLFVCMAYCVLECGIIVRYDKKPMSIDCSRVLALPCKLLSRPPAALIIKYRREMTRKVIFLTLVDGEKRVLNLKRELDKALHDI